MMRQLVMAGLLAATTSIAHAATLSLKWVVNESRQALAVVPGGSAQVNVYLDMPNDNGAVGTVFFSFASDPYDALYLDHADTTPMAGWVAGGQSGYLGGLAQFAVADPHGQHPIRNGAFLVGSFEVQNHGSFNNWTMEICANAHEDQGVLDPAGNPLTWDARYHANYDSFVAYGEWGSPGWDPPGKAEGQPAAPLILIGFPEPATGLWLALVAAGLLRRR